MLYLKTFLRWMVLDRFSVKNDIHEATQMIGLMQSASIFCDKSGKKLTII